MADTFSFRLTEAVITRLSGTVGNPEWMRANQQALMQALPSNWTPAADDTFLLCFGFAIKCLGVEWRETQEVIMVLAWLQKLGWCEAKADPHAATDNIRRLIIRRCVR